MLTPLHDRASSQGGVLLAGQAVELGYTWDEFQRTVRAEEWTRLFFGAYLAPGYTDDPLTRTRAVQKRWPSLVASHGLASFIHGFTVVGAPPMTFTATDKSRRTLPSAHLYRWLLPDSDVVEVDGVRVTSEVRTVTDLLRIRDRDAAVIAADSALNLRRLNLDVIAERLERLSGEPGIRRAWNAFPILDPKAQAPTESKTRLIMWDRKIYPQTQVPILAPDGTTYFLDFLVEGVVFEPEGFEYHGDPAAHQADVNRFNALARAARGHGLDVCRLTFVDCFGRERATGDLIVSTILARRRRLGLSGPPIGR